MRLIIIKEKMNELLTWAVELIKEFGELSKFICDGESIIVSIGICEDGDESISKRIWIYK